MNLAALISGGKDSLYAMHLAQKQGHEIKYIVSVHSENPESYMFHHPNHELVSKQAEIMKIPLIKCKTMGIKEHELEDLEKCLSKLDIDGVVTGAVASNYQKQRIDKICDNLNIESIALLWQKNPEELLMSMLQTGFEIIIVNVAAEGLTKEWLGRKLDFDCIRDLRNLNEKHGVSMVGEGGEYETFVLNAPMFRQSLKVISQQVFWDNKTRSGWMKIDVE